MLHPDARISATMQVKIQSHPGERWTVSCCALNKRDGRPLTGKTVQLLYQYRVKCMSAAPQSQGKHGCKSLLKIDLRRKPGPPKFSKNPENVASRRVSCMQNGPYFGSLNSEFGRGGDRLRVPHDDWPVRVELGWLS